MDRVASRVLLVGRDTATLQGYKNPLEESGFSLRIRDIGAGILGELSSFKPHSLIAEILEPGINWRKLLREIRERQPNIPVIFIVSPPMVKETEAATRNEVADFLIKPIGMQTLVFRLRKALEGQNLQEDLRNLQAELRFRRNRDYIVGASSEIQSLLNQIIKAAGSDPNVLITGETGTGKELVARAIHYNSARSGHPFISVNCSAIPESLQENQLFGHEKGGYTGADTTTEGLYEQADGGTLFLDEIGDIPLSLQPKLLKILDSGEFQKIGGTRTLRVNVRTLAATHKDLTTEIEEKRFRDDIYYRLNVFPIHVPPLRDRRDDIPSLVNHFFRLYEPELKETLKGFSTSAIQKLMFHDWPGNVRELENRVRQAMIHATGLKWSGLVGQRIGKDK